jgi:FG-GAP repeat
VGIPFYPSLVYATPDLHLSIERTASPTASSLELIEVEVYLKPQPSINIASGSTFTNQVSTSSPSASAVDGNTGTFSATTSSTSAHWWVAYLGSLAWQDIYRIRITFRSAGSSMIGSTLKLIISPTTGFTPTLTDNDEVVYQWPFQVNTLNNLPFDYIPLDLESTRWTTQTKLVPSGLTTDSLFGSSHAKNQHDTFMIVGAYGYSTSNGAVWVYRRSRADWHLLAGPITGAGNTGPAAQGVGTAAWGNTVAWGGYVDNSGAGRTWVYECSDVECVEQASLVGTGNSGPAFQGLSVALYGDTLVVGGPLDGSNVGATWVFTRSGGVWTQQGDKLVGTSSSGSSQQGARVAVWGDTLVTSGFGDSSGVGAVWVFTRSGGVWTQQGSKLTPTGGVGAMQFGTSLALYEDMMAVGAPGDNGNIGAVYIFTRSGGVWTQQARIVGSNPVAGNKQGFGLSLWDGFLAVGGDSPQGFTYIHRLISGSWREVRRVNGTGRVGEIAQGFSVSIRNATLTVGGRFDNSSRGALWTFLKD